MKKIIIALIVVAILGGAGFYAYKSGHLDKFFNGSYHINDSDPYIRIAD